MIYNPAKLAHLKTKLLTSMKCNYGIIKEGKQEHLRGSIVEPHWPQDGLLHQDGLNSLSYHGLKNPIIIVHVYDIF